LVPFDAKQHTQTPRGKWRRKIKRPSGFFFSYVYNVQLHNAQSRTYGLKAQVGIVGGVVLGFMTGIHRDLVLQVECLVSLSWCIRLDTRREGNKDADYLSSHPSNPGLPGRWLINQCEPTLQQCIK